MEDGREVHQGAYLQVYKLLPVIQEVLIHYTLS